MTPSIAQLKATATALDAKTSDHSALGNETKTGLWRRIAAALEEGAGVANTRNETLQGYMERAALAAEAKWGGSGAEEQLNRFGLVKRVVDAMEISGGVGSGSLGNRLKTASPAVTFGAAALTAINFSRARPDRMTTVSAQALGSANRYMTVALIGFKMNSLPTAAMTLFGLTSGIANIRVLVSTAGVLQFNMRGAAGTPVIANGSVTGALTAGVSYDIFLTFDAGSATSAGGVTAYANDSAAAFSTSWLGTTGVTFGYADAAIYQFGGLSAAPGSAQAFDGSIKRVAINAHERKDITSQPVRDAIRAYAALSDWEIDLSGPLASWNSASGLNRGTGPKFYPDTSTGTALT